MATGETSFLVYLTVGFTLTDKKKLDYNFYCKAAAFGFFDCLFSENLLTKELLDILDVSKGFTFGKAEPFALVLLIDEPYRLAID